MITKLRFIFTLAFIAGLKVAFAQAPIISYTSPQVYKVGVAISPLSPTNTGGAVSPTTPVTLSGTFNNLTGIAVDASGNVYVAENGNSAVREIPVGGGAPVTLGSGFSNPPGVAVDGAGNVYVTDYYNGAVKEIPAGNGAVITIASGLSGPYGITIDATGNLYFSEFSSSDVKKISAGSGTPVTIGSGFNNPAGIAVDASGNVYVADRSNNAIKKILATNGSTVTLSGGSGNPDGVAVDASGNVYYADTNLATLIEIPAGGGGNIAIGSGFLTPTCAAVDAKGDIFIGDNGHNVVKEIAIGGYKISPGLPAGLTLDVNTGVISGTPTAGAAAANYTVTAANSSGTGTAVINITITASTNAYLSNLTVKTATLSPAFAFKTLGYTSNVPNSTSSVTVTPASLDATATIQVNGMAVASKTASAPIALAAGTNTINIVVTAQDGVTTKTYEVTITRAPSAIATLANLQLSSGILTPVFATGTTGYTATVATTTTAITVTPTTTDTVARVTVNGKAVNSNTTSGAISLAIGANTITTVVTAQDGVTTDTYTTTVTRDASGTNNAYLSNLKVTTATLSPAFAFKTFAYTSNVPYATSSVTVTPSLLDAAASVTVNGSPVANKTASGPIVLAAGTNTVNVTVTARDGISTQNYTIAIIHPSGPPPNISYASPQVYTVGAAISPLSPTNTGGAVSPPGLVVLQGTFNNLTGIAVDASGNVYVAENGNSAVREIPAGGGAPVTLGSGFNHPPGVAVDAAGNVYVTDFYNNAVKEIPAGNGTVVTVALGLNGPYGIAIDATGNLYFSEFNTNDVKKIPAGSSTPVTIGSGFSNPTGIAVDASGNVYVADRSNNAIKKILATNGKTVTLSSGSGNPDGVAVDASGNVYYADTNITALIEIPAGGGNNIAIGSGFFTPTCAAVDTKGDIFIGDTGNGVVKEITAGGYKISPSLPAGLTLDANTGVISGTPTAVKAEANYTVTAANGNGSGTAVIAIRVADANEAYLSNLKVTTAALSPAFAFKTFAYTSTVPNSTNSVTVTPSLLDAAASVTVNGVAVASKTASGPTTLAVGTNTINVVVIAEDGITTNTYTVTITRAAGPVNGFDPGLSVNNPAEHPVLNDNLIVVHSGLSPNGDGVNDFLQIDNINQYPNNKLSIMNRNGQLIYEAQGYDNSSKVFDGHSNKNGHMQVSGTYFYQLDYTANGITKHKTGFIVLKY